MSRHDPITTKTFRGGIGNHIDAIRNSGSSTGFSCRMDMTHKRCTGCGQKKPKKGGTSPTEKLWKCADCKNKSVN